MLSRTSIFRDIQGVAVEMVTRLDEAALDRRHGIAAEIIVILAEHSLQQQPDLDILCLLRSGNGQVSYLGIHTRTSEISFSTSSGLAM